MTYWFVERMKVAVPIDLTAISAVMPEDELASPHCETRDMTYDEHEELENRVNINRQLRTIGCIVTYGATPND